VLLVISSRSRSLRSSSSSPKYKVQTYNTAMHGGQWPGAINVTSVLAGGAACTHGARGSGHSRCVHSPLACLRACATPHPRLEHRHPPPPCLLAALSLLPLSLHHMESAARVVWWCRTQEVRSCQGLQTLKPSPNTPVYDRRMLLCMALFIGPEMQLRAPLRHGACCSSETLRVATNIACYLA
jgi:hypothetical protein